VLPKGLGDLQIVLRINNSREVQFLHCVRVGTSRHPHEVDDSHGAALEPRYSGVDEVYTSRCTIMGWKKHGVVVEAAMVLGNKLGETCNVFVYEKPRLKLSLYPMS